MDKIDEEQKKVFARVLSNYPSVTDIILLQKKEKNPLAFLITKDKSLADSLKRQLGLDTIGVLEPEEIYQTSIGISLICEGFSIKRNSFLNEITNIHPMKIYSYSIGKFTPTEKRQFNRGLLKALEATKGTKLGAGCCMIPAESSPYFEEFLSVWKDLQYKARRWNVFQEIN